MQDITIVPIFDFVPSDEQVAKLIAESEMTPPLSKRDVEVAVEKARKWLTTTTRQINEMFSLSGEGTAELKYREDEDLGLECRLSGSSPFNDSFGIGGPTLHLVLTGKVRIGLPGMMIAVVPQSQDAIFERISSDEDGKFLLIVWLKNLRLYVAIRRKDEDED